MGENWRLSHFGLGSTPGDGETFVCQSSCCFPSLLALKPTPLEKRLLGPRFALLLLFVLLRDLQSFYPKSAHDLERTNTDGRAIGYAREGEEQRHGEEILIHP